MYQITNTKVSKYRSMIHELTDRVCWVLDC